MVPGYDRVAERRSDARWLEEAWASPGARVLVVAGTRFRAPNGRLEWRRTTQAPAGTRVLLGLEGERVSFAVFAGPELAADETWVGLRAVAPLVDSGDLPYLMHAVGLAEWHWAVRFCPRCGGPLESRQSGHVLGCSVCNREQFPRTDPAVIMLITDQDDRALLGRQRSWPQGRWSTLAGFVEPGERLADAVRREVREESGVLVGDVHYVDSQPWPLPASLMLGFTGRALGTDIAVDGTELEDARWFSRAAALAGARDGSLVIPPGISISRALITGWYGADLPGSWG
jgi:NAD+ diphosphatase